MSYRYYPPSEALLFGYDPATCLEENHLARLVDFVVEETLDTPPYAPAPGQPAFDPRLLLKVLTYGYATGIRSSRRLQQACKESLPFLLLTRGEAPSYRTLCSARLAHKESLEQIFATLIHLARNSGMPRLGRIAIDSTKIRADVSPDSVLRKRDFDTALEIVERILSEAEQADAAEKDTPDTSPLAPRGWQSLQVRDIVRQVKRCNRQRKQQQAREGSQSPAPPSNEPAPAPDKEQGPRAQEAPDQEPEPRAPETPHQEALELCAPAEQDRRACGSIPAHRRRMMERLRRLREHLLWAKQQGLKHLGLSDADASMMGIGRSKNVAPGYSFEVAAEAGLLVWACSTTSQNDYERLVPLTQAAGACTSVETVLADSGYYSHMAVSALESQGIKTVIPTAFTARDLRSGQELGTTRAAAIGGSREHLAYDASADEFVCSQGNRLSYRGTDARGWRRYSARRACSDCALGASCLSSNKSVYRTLKVQEDADLLEQVQARFGQADHRRLYFHRAPEVETIFGFMRRVLGFERWSVRGEARVSCEASLLKVAYQLRKIHTFVVRSRGEPLIAVG